MVLYCIQCTHLRSIHNKYINTHTHTVFALLSYSQGMWFLPEGTHELWPWALCCLKLSLLFSHALSLPASLFHTWHRMKTRHQHNTKIPKKKQKPIFNLYLYSALNIPPSTWIPWYLQWIKNRLMLLSWSSVIGACFELVRQVQYMHLTAVQLMWAKPVKEEAQKQSWFTRKHLAWCCPLTYQ